MKYPALVFCALLTALPPALGAVDFGLQVEQYVAADENNTIEESYSSALIYRGTINPWISFPMGDRGGLYISAQLTPWCESGPMYEAPGWFFVPELDRLEFKYRSIIGSEIRIGRFAFRDPLDLIASGVFDGLSLSGPLGGGVLGLGAWYTGLRYGKTAGITMTEADREAYAVSFSFDNPIDTLLASRRLLAVLDYEHPAIAGFIQLKTALIGQFDLNGRDEGLHSQYLAAKITVPYKSGLLVLEAGGALELMESTVRDDPLLGMTGELSLAWLLPTRIPDRLSLLGRYSSSEDGDIFGDFTPVTTRTQGQVVRAKLSGISLVQADYTFRPGRAFQMDVQATYFFRDDPWKRFLGGEIFGRIVWMPVTELRLTLGCGIFLPSLGNVMDTASWDDSSKRRVELGMICVF